jgi:hypothetical protein
MLAGVKLGETVNIATSLIPSTWLSILQLDSDEVIAAQFKIFTSTV